MADEPHKHEWEDAWGADCVVCHVDLIGYAESAQERITTLETQYAAAMAIAEKLVSLWLVTDDSHAPRRLTYLYSRDGAVDVEALREEARALLAGK